MKKILHVPTEQMHRVIVQFLLEESLTQYSLATRSAGLEESLLKCLIDENKKHLDKQFFAMVDNTQWWRRVRRVIEEAGLNHYTIAKILAGKEVEL